MKDENALLGPPPVVTIMPTAPAVVRAGVIQVIVVLFTTLIVVTIVLQLHLTEILIHLNLHYSCNFDIKFRLPQRYSIC